MYQHIVFMQDSDADEVSEIMNKSGYIGAISHMSQWDYGEYTDKPITFNELLEEVGDGTWYEYDGYMMHRQSGGINYSLYRKID